MNMLIRFFIVMALLKREHSESNKNSEQNKTAQRESENAVKFPLKIYSVLLVEVTVSYRMTWVFVITYPIIAIYLLLKLT